MLSSSNDKQVGLTRPFCQPGFGGGQGCFYLFAGDAAFGDPLGQGRFQFQIGVDVELDHRAEALELADGELLQRFAHADGEYHSFADDMVRFTEWNPLGYQIVRQLGSVGIAALRRRHGALTIHLQID